ncbi:MAG: universal stress protein [Bacteroidales bacterium]|nr:universal stress protein [Bacteroidales bacterium]
MMKTSSFITMRDISYSRALLLRMQLELRGVDCFISGIQSGEADVDLWVEPQHAALAMQLYDDMRSAAGSQKEQWISHLRRVRRILVPVDFSERSIKAAHYALELARTLKAELRLLHVWFQSGTEGLVFNEMYAFQADLGPMMREQEQLAMDQLNELSETLKNRVKAERIRGVKISTDLVRGNTIDTLLAIVDEFEPGLVVMGTRGKNRDSRSLIGSTTSRMMARCNVPVLAVPEGYDISHFIAPKTVAYITHYEKSDFQALHRLISFVKPFHPKIYCLHVESEPNQVVDRLMMQQFREEMLSSRTTANIECGLIQAENPVEAIEAFVDEKKVDVIAIVMRKRSLLKQLFEPSLTRRLLYQTHLPLLVFRESNEK